MPQADGQHPSHLRVVSTCLYYAIKRGDERPTAPIDLKDGGCVYSRQLPAARSAQTRSPIGDKIVDESRLARVRPWTGVMSVDDEIDNWIQSLKQGDDRAAQVIWESYFEELAAFARRKLGTAPRRAEDEEDVALSALQSFCQGVADKRFPKLDDRFDLWKILVTITARKVVARQRRQLSQKRGQGKVRGESALSVGLSDSHEGNAIDQVLGNEPSPELVLSLADQCSELLGTLDERHKPIALLKMEGYTNKEIAERVDVALRTVERRLEHIRALWSNRVEPGGDG